MGLLGNMQQTCDIVARNWGSSSNSSSSGTSDSMYSSSSSSSSSSFCVQSVFAQAVIRYVDAILVDTMPGICPGLNTEGLDRAEGSAVATFALYWAGASLQHSSCHEGEWGRTFQDARRMQSNSNNNNNNNASPLSIPSLLKKKEHKEETGNNNAKKDQEDQDNNNNSKTKTSSTTTNIFCHA